MAVLVERRISSAVVWSRRLAWFSGVLFVVAGASHRFGLLETIPFLWVLAIIAILAATAVLLAAAGFSRIWSFGEPGARDAMFGGALGLAVLSPFLFAGYCVFAYPQLHDISTDPSDPPLLTLAARQRGPGMNTITGIDAESAALQQERYPEVVSRRYDLPTERVQDIVDQLVATRGWKPIGTSTRSEGDDPDAAAVTMEFLAGSPVVGFPSDVAIRLIEEDASTYVDMRSASRYGRHDFGDNARRIEGFLGEMDKQVQLQAGIAAPEATEQ